MSTSIRIEVESFATVSPSVFQWDCGHRGTPWYVEVQSRTENAPVKFRGHAKGKAIDADAELIPACRVGSRGSVVKAD